MIAEAIRTSVTLDDEQLANVEDWATQRTGSHVESNNAHGYKGASISIDRIGVGAEYAAALACDLFCCWIPVSENYKKLPSDVGLLSVKGTSRANGGLIGHREDDHSDFPRLLVTCEEWPTFNLRGWLWVSDIQDECYWRVAGMRNPCFIAPQRVLYPLEGLTKYLPSCHWRACPKFHELLSDS